MNVKLAVQLCQNMGRRYIAYRVRHEMEKRLGRLKKRHPATLALQQTISLSDWLKYKKPFAIDAKERLALPKSPTSILQQKAERILKGELQYFNADWINIGKDYDWITNPSNDYRYDSNKHWSEIADLSDESGDIKYVWEKSRFSYLLTLIRYDYHYDVDVSEFVFSEIDSWVATNPINQGPNWRCSQEISLRILNWCAALYYYQNSPALTEERWQRIQQVIYASLHHVYHHIDFSRIAVRNNHAITETLFLALSDILFPFIPETKKWAKEGLRWFEKEVEYQIYDDGTFLQFSMNYHRVVVQLFSLGISVFQQNKRLFSPYVYYKAYKSLNFLYQCMQDENGKLPNYGANDGALFFPWADADYRDYRPQLNTLHYILTGRHLFEQDLTITEDLQWHGKVSISNPADPISKIEGVQSFDEGGYYLCRSGDYFTFLRCGNHKNRPAQADNLHIDIWCKGENLLRDSGTYKYNTEKKMLNYFMGTLSHNTVMVENHSQMLKGGRFIWYYWTQCIDAGWQETDEAFVFSGEIRAFNQLSPTATHKRMVKIFKNDAKWEVFDVVTGLDGSTKKQIWHPNNEGVNIVSEERKPVIFNSFNSDYYGGYTSEQSVYFDFEDNILTTIVHKSN